MTDPNTDGAALVAAYTNPARFGSRHSRPLAILLRKTAPTDLDPRAVEALVRLEQRAQEVEDIATARERQAPPAVRGPRITAGGSWSNLHAALGCVAQVTGDPAGAEAARVHGTLFPEGVAFVQLDAHALWAMGDRLLRRIDDENLGPAIEAVVHPALLRDVRTAHTQLGVATGLAAGVPVAPSSRSLLEARSRFAFAVCDYARAVSVGLDIGDRDAVARFANAMAPIDTYRITRATEDAEDSTDAPTPPVDGGGPPAPFAG
jgi:hypothetical protein